MSKWRTWSRILALALVSAMTAGLLAACGGGNEQPGANEERVLRIATSYGSGPNDEWLRREYTEIFEFMHPEIEIEIVATYDERMRYGYRSGGSGDEDFKTPMEMLKEQLEGPTPPDVIIMNLEDIRELSSEGYLQPLDPLIQKAEMNLDEFVPAVVEGLKSQSDDGNLYGLAPMFSSSVLMYNKKHFADLNLPFPTDGMTWDEVFNLARQVSRGEGNDRIYGFSFSNYRYNDIWYDMNVYTAPLQLQMFDENAERMLVNNQDWKDVWNTMIELKNEGVFPEPRNWNDPIMMQPFEQGPYDYNSMLSGKVAMAIVHYYDLVEIINVNRSAANIEGFEPIDWDVVSVPTHPQAPDVGGNVWLNGVIGISNNAQNSDDAWKFIEFLMSERWAQTKSKSINQLVTWKKYNEPIDGLDYNLEAFFRNKPVINTMYNSKLYREMPDLWQVQHIGQMKFQEVLNEDKTVDEALAEWETEGNATLTTLKENNGYLYPQGEMSGISTEVIDAELSEAELEKMEEELRRLQEAAGEIVEDSDGTEE